jgi:mono/diheme cytochrome c family protein
MLYGAMLTAGLAVIAGLIVMYSGWYSVAASSEHTRLVYWALEQGMRASVRHHAARVRAPDLQEEAALRQGAHCFQMHCVQCHGGPGIAPSDLGKSLLPIPNSLTQTARDWPIEHIYWVTRNGIRMAGMPAWEFRLADEDLWAIAAFVDRELPRLTVDQYRRRIENSAGESCRRPTQRAPPDAQRGLLTLRQYACHGCHIIPGITGPRVHVGPTLEKFARRPLIAGVLPNTPDNLIRWLREPQAMRPRSLMPDMEVTEQHAQDMAAYLGTLR